MTKISIVKMLALAAVVAATLHISAFANAAEDTGSGAVEGSGANGKAMETPAQRTARMAWWREARFGMFIHYGPVTLTGKELSWSRANSNTNCPNKGATPVEVYDNLYKRFNPTNFNAADWAGVAKAAGMKYVVLTAKHCDGFLLWDSKADAYNIMHTPFKRDIGAELSQAVRGAGLHMGWYFSPMDWRDPDCRSTNNDRFVAHMQDELRELLTNYGKVDALWFDSDGRPTMWHPETTYPLVKSLQPQIIIDNRLQLDTGEQWAHQEKLKLRENEDFYTPEQKVGAYDDQQPWESCMTLGTQWSWKPNDKIKSAAEVVSILAQTAGGDGNLLLDVGPMPDGRIEPRQVEVLKKVGAWMEVNGESIYATRGGPWKPAKQIASTRKGNTVYVFVLNRKQTDIALPVLPKKVVSANVLGGGSVNFETTNGKVVLHLQPRQAWTATVVKLELDGSATDIPTIALPETASASTSEKSSLPLTGVTFSTTGTNRQKLYHRAGTMERRNIVQFTATMMTLLEGGGYGPTLLAVLEQLSRMHGVHFGVVNGQVWWPACDGTDFSYSQRWGDPIRTMTSSNVPVRAESDGRKIFAGSTSCRVVTDLDGRVIEMIGSSSRSNSVTIELNGQLQKPTIKPDKKTVSKIDVPIHTPGQPPQTKFSAFHQWGAKHYHLAAGIEEQHNLAAVAQIEYLESQHA